MEISFGRPSRTRRVRVNKTHGQGRSEVLPCLSLGHNIFLHLHESKKKRERESLQELGENGGEEVGRRERPSDDVGRPVVRSLFHARIAVVVSSLHGDGLKS